MCPSERPAWPAAIDPPSLIWDRSPGEEARRRSGSFQNLLNSSGGEVGGAAAGGRRPRSLVKFLSGEAAYEDAGLSLMEVR